MKKILVELSKTELVTLQKSDLAAIMNMQEEVFSYIDDTQILRRNTEQTFSVCFEKPSITYGLIFEKELIAFGMLYCAGTTDENLAYELNPLPSDLESVANVKVIMVRPAYRGNGLQKYFIDVLEQYAKSIGIKTLLSTVSPLNQYSLNNFYRCGFTVVKQTKKYGGLSRVLLIKPID